MYMAIKILHSYNVINGGASWKQWPRLEAKILIFMTCARNYAHIKLHSQYL